MDMEFPVSRLTYAQFMSARSRNGNNGAELSSLPTLTLKHTSDVHQLLARSPISLKDALAMLPSGMHVNLQILYPSAQEERSLRLGPTVNINTFGDAVLAVVFDHAGGEQRPSKKL